MVEIHTGKKEKAIFWNTEWNYIKCEILPESLTKFFLKEKHQNSKNTAKWFNGPRDMLQYCKFK